MLLAKKCLFRRSLHSQLAKKPSDMVWYFQRYIFLDMYRLNPRCFLEWHSRVSLCGGYLCILTARNECWLANGAPNNKKASAGLYVDSPLSQFPEFSDSPNSTLFPALRLLGLGRWASGNWSRSPATMGPEWAKTG